MTNFKSLIDPVLAEIFGKEQDHLDSVLSNLIDQNQALGGTMNAFRVDGKLVSLIPIKHLRGVKISPLSSDLEASYRRYDDRQSQLNSDKKKILHALSMVVSKCRHAQDLRDCLPDVISNQIPAFQRMERMNQEGFVLNEHPMLLKQYQKAMDIALYYQANRLIH